MNPGIVYVIGVVVALMVCGGARVDARKHGELMFALTVLWPVAVVALACCLPYLLGRGLRWLVLKVIEGSPE